MDSFPLGTTEPPNVVFSETVAGAPCWVSIARAGIAGSVGCCVPAGAERADECRDPDRERRQHQQRAEQSQPPGVGASEVRQRQPDPCRDRDATGEREPRRGGGTGAVGTGTVRTGAAGIALGRLPLPRGRLPLRR